MDDNELEIEVIPSPHDPVVGAHVGVRIRHKTSGLTAESSSETTQYANKRNTLEMLKIQLSVARQNYKTQ
jgi:protein subunit release factor A